ncbi:hypothetical protein G9U51_15735 [Calidifontibacter sp. DB0510]|uniref:Uncharacterized protein n=1 Tax=Metallococcus carri TaxID=1656884 RepID=A0A967B474_9MICO|nr:hypothetical protein [Metallococcus carri]NHN57223.1 hypothetical protein [Metallococcus carri]NOP37974.1 hypothetical protein [Calidifontibacter sp. DB2511S]
MVMAGSDTGRRISYFCVLSWVALVGVATLLPTALAIISGDLLNAVVLAGVNYLILVAVLALVSGYCGPDAQFQVTSSEILVASTWDVVQRVPVDLIDNCQEVDRYADGLHRLTRIVAFQGRIRDDHVIALFSEPQLMGSSFGILQRLWGAVLNLAANDLAFPIIRRRRYAGMVVPREVALMINCNCQDGPTGGLARGAESRRRNE